MHNQHQTSFDFLRADVIRIPMTSTSQQDTYTFRETAESLNTPEHKHTYSNFS